MLQSRPAIVTVLAMLTLPTAAANAQDPAALAARICADGVPATGDLGYQRMACNCTLYEDDSDPTRNWWEFRSEPVIQQVRSSGPAEGRLAAGDVVVAIDDQLITTHAGGRRFAQVRPGDTVRLMVRRQGRERTVQITVGAYCAGEMPPKPPPAPAGALPPSQVPVAVSAPPARPADPAPAEPVPVPPPPSPMPRGWFGFSLQCSDCGFQVLDSEAAPIWRFSSPPLVEHVEPHGPADRAGLQAGDIITHIDGVPLTTEEGGIAFGAVEPGRTVALRFSRGGQERTARLRVTERAAVIPPAEPKGEPRPREPEDTASPTALTQPDVLRFFGRVGDALIRVTGRPVTVTETETEVVIRSHDITVRISRQPSKDQD